MDRRVKSAKRDQDGNIVALCNPGQSWSPRRAKDVARDINTGRQSYYVQEEVRRSYVRSESGVLRSTADAADQNSLGKLPSC
jgi:hypothetical protein